VHEILQLFISFGIFHSIVRIYTYSSFMSRTNRLRFAFWPMDSWRILLLRIHVFSLIY